MSSREEYLFKELYDGALWLEYNGILHIDGYITGKPGHWVAHPLCGKRLRHYIGFGELKYAKTSFVCKTCFLLYAIKTLSNKIQPPIKVGKEIK
jgi:hypothetical protein